MATIPKKIIDRFQQHVGRFQKVLQAGKDRDINESDTVVIIADILSSVFGFDKYTEITSECAVRSTYCDLAIKLDGSIKYLIEVKSIGIGLKETHLRQAMEYGANLGIDWVVLTNGINWEIHKILFQKPVGEEKVCEFNFLELNVRKEEDQQKLFLLCKEGMSRDAIVEFHQRKQAVNRFIIGALLLADPCMSVLRRELKRIAPEIRLDNEEIEQTLRAEVLKREVIDCENAIQARAVVKRAMGRALRSRSTGQSQDGECAQSEAAQETEALDAN